MYVDIVISNAFNLNKKRFSFSFLTTFAFRLSEVRRLLLDLDPYGGTDP